MLELFVIGGLCGALAATGAFRWFGRAILLLFVIAVLGYKLVATVLVASVGIGIAWAFLWAFLEARTERLGC